MKSTQLNSVTLRGVVGHTKTTKVTDTNSITRFTLVTNLIYKDAEGMAVIENTWHDCVAFSALGVAKGDTVEVVGRIRNQQCTNDNGSNYIYSSIIVTQFKKMKGPLEAQALE